MEQNNYSIKIINVYIFYDLDNWPKNSLGSFTLKNCLFGSTNIVKNNDKEKNVYSGYGIAFDGGGSWSFNDEFARNVKIFEADNSSSFHTKIFHMIFRVLGKRDSFGINGSFVAPEKMNINFSKVKTE